MNFDKSSFEKMKAEIKNLLEVSEDKLQSVCKYLHDHVPYYNWVGFYLVDGSKKLKLGPRFAAEASCKSICSPSNLLCF